VHVPASSEQWRWLGGALVVRHLYLIVVDCLLARMHGVSQTATQR